VGEGWEDVNWDGVGHGTCINRELGTFVHLLYPGMVTVTGRWIVVWSWTHWALKPHTDQDTFQDGVSTIPRYFQILLVSYFVAQF
jgi:hypothetical protein